MKINIVDLAIENQDYRKVIYTGVDSQLVVMNIKPGEDIGEEMYQDVDQITVIIEGKGELTMQGEDNSTVVDNDLIFVSAGKYHNIKNIGDNDLKLYTIYAPPEFQPNTVEEFNENSDKSFAEDNQSVYGEDWENNY